MARKHETTAKDAPGGNNSHAAQSLALLFEWNTEISRFYLHRFSQYWTLPARLQTCRTREDLEGLQSTFLTELVDDYTEEASKLSAITNTAHGRRDADPSEVYAKELLKAQRDAAEIIEEAKLQAEHIRKAARQPTAASETTSTTARARKRA